MSETTIGTNMQHDSATGERPLLEIKDLEVGFKTQTGMVSAVNGVNITLYRGQSLAIVGESGSGKSTTAHAIINLLPGSGRITGGQILLDGQDLTKASKKEMESVRGRKIGFVPQDPMSNLNPVWSIGFQVEEGIRANGIATGRKEVKKRAIEVLKQAGLHDADRRLKQFPHQFSGGMRQRVLIGMGLAADPQLLIADEPTSALDVTVQRVILDHLESLTRELGTTLLFITHDLGLAAERAEQLVVMYKGRVVESGPSRQILENPQHPYTQRLVAAAPSLASRRIQATGSIHAAEQSMGADAESAAGDAIDLIATAEARAEALESAADQPPAIVVEDLTKVFKIRGSGDFTAVDQVSFQIPKGTTTALVGESGSGKSTVAKMLLKLESATSGKIVVGGKDLASVTGKELFDLRSRMQPVFQDPYGSLNPLRNIGNTIGEPLSTHSVGTRASRRERVFELLDQVSLPRSLAGRYPNELSGGQRQRIAIARALALKPEILVLDEAVSALDVLVQAQILRLLADLQAELDLTYLFITHDLAVVRVIADQVCVMQKGKIVEAASTDEVFETPKQQYTRDLLAAIPGANLKLGA
ncbi:ABC transporter ATP-binding protein [Agromyces aerolatus]|uniref:ABC transporter ATP-binding protein n=1 Tax=Agromyces sp. LY-1074 TaxID=3074080 RepID=UPI00286040F2|nr:MULTISPECIES: ABC transporter ATP-binding protein [unclassified Agromyces]MDR5698902.1 ABC transporter ATP-binding protein [Agromyces sp. LY-1074]MDR5705320.1 ABC transporter ATP-binding protein [Agromyces sp. LY-1358]